MRGWLRRRGHHAAVAGNLAGMRSGMTATTTPTGGRLVHVRVERDDLVRMSERQLDDLRTGLALLSAAMCPDGYFAELAEPTVDRMARVELLQRLAELDDLPVAEPA